MGTILIPKVIVIILKYLEKQNIINERLQQYDRIPFHDKLKDTIRPSAYNEPKYEDHRMILLIKDDVLMTVDDKQRVVDMWRAEGLTCLKVVTGDF